jgi:FkbM family methyltransferase
MQSLKTGIHEFIRTLGFEVWRTRPYGFDEWHDIKSIYGGRALGTVFDVGANAGQTARMLRGRLRAREVFSFEPNEKTFQQLVANTRADSHVRPFNLALGDVSQEQTFYVTTYNCTDSLLRPSKDAARFFKDLTRPDREAKVKVVTLDDFCSSHDIGHIDLLKLDVQGFELKVLDGAKRMLQEQRVPLILTEVNFARMYEGQAFFHDVYQKLLPDYRLLGLYGWNYQSGPFLDWADALFVNPAALERRQT